MSEDSGKRDDSFEKLPWWMKIPLGLIGVAWMMCPLTTAKGFTAFLGLTALIMIGAAVAAAISPSSRH